MADAGKGMLEDLSYSFFFFLTIVIIFIYSCTPCLQFPTLVASTFTHSWGFLSEMFYAFTNTCKYIIYLHTW